MSLSFFSCKVETKYISYLIIMKIKKKKILAMAGVAQLSRALKGHGINFWLGYVQEAMSLSHIGISFSLHLYFSFSKINENISPSAD